MLAWQTYRNAQTVGQEYTQRDTAAKGLMDRRLSLLIAGVTLALLIAAKFLFLLAENDFDISQAPVAFLLPMLVLIIGVVLAAAGRRSGVVMVGLVALLLLPVFVNAVIQRGFAQQNAADTVLVFAGIPLAIVALVASFALMTGTTRRDDPHGRHP